MSLEVGRVLEFKSVIWFVLKLSAVQTKVYEKNEESCPEFGVKLTNHVGGFSITKPCIT